jgi:hypothetical protein
MGIHYTVYCKKAAHVTPAELLKGVTAADLPALAKKEGVSDDEIEAALDVLHIDNLKPPGFVVYRLCYRKSGMRQVDIECWEDKDDVQAVLDEELEELVAEHHPHSKPIRTHLKQCVDVIDTSIGNPNEPIARVLARQTACWLAGHFDGIIRTADEKWWRLDAAGELVPL